MRAVLSGITQWQKQLGEGGCHCKPGSWESDRAKLDMWREGRRERSMREAQGQDNNRAFPNSVAEGVLPTSDKAVLYHLGFSQRP